SFAVTSGAACSNAAGKLHVLTGTGTCKVTATKAGDADYLPVDSAEFEVAIHKAAQVALVVTDPTDATFGHADYSVLTSGGSSSGAVSFAVTSGAACSNAAGKLQDRNGVVQGKSAATRGRRAKYHPDDPAEI